MSFTSSFDAKEQIRQAIDIVDLAGQYLQLRREGRIYKALCPWHDDSRPSLQINPERQSFKCWVCNIGGDIFSFLMKIENVEFPEALAMLAERAGVSLQRSRATAPAGRPGLASGGRDSPDDAAPPANDSNDKRTLYRVVAWAEEQYHRCLLESADAEIARRYLDERGLSTETIAKYKLGFGPPAWDWLLSRARVAGFNEKVLERAGLCKPRPNGPGHYDYFRGRALFPIRDPQGRPVAFGGRILPQFAEQNPAKYINSPETPLFSKSKLLYGLDTARDVISKSRCAIVMEGYTDVLIARQFGIANAVAVLGTALNREHIRPTGPLRRYADSVTLVLDGDEAGQRRSSEILELFIAELFDLRVATLPDNLDPCDFLLQRGAEAFQSVVAEAVDALEHAFRVTTRGLDIRREPHEANRALDRMLQTIAKAPRLSANTSSDHLIREATMLARLARMFEVHEELLRRRIGDLRRSTSASARPKLRGDNFVEVEPLALSAWERELLELVLLEPESVPAMAQEIRADSLVADHLRLVYARCCDLAAAGITPDFDRLMIEFDDERIKSLLVDVEEQARLKSGGLTAPGRLRDLLAWHRGQHKELAVQSQARALRDEKLSDDEAMQVLQELIQQERNRRGISAPTERQGLGGGMTNDETRMTNEAQMTNDQ
ncbi:MAG: DNA primase [Pirellulales bacterium]